MGKKLIIILGVIIFVLVMVVFTISRVVSVTGPLIWIDRSSQGSWKHGANAVEWWEQLSILNPNMIDKNRRVIVYLLPNLQPSRESVSKKDREPFVYSDWRMWGSDIRVLTISINYDEWEAIDPVERQQKLAEHITFVLAKYWGVIPKTRDEMSDKMLDKNMELPIKLITTSKGTK